MSSCANQTLPPGVQIGLPIAGVAIGRTLSRHIGVLFPSRPNPRINGTLQGADAPACVKGRFGGREGGIGRALGEAAARLFQLITRGDSGQESQSFRDTCLVL
jgi:hypothetical protein